MVYNNRKIVEINEKTYIVEFMEKDTSVDYVKWHNYNMQNRDDMNDFYVIQIVQEKDSEPCFMVEYFTEIDSFGNAVGAWDYLGKYFYPDDASKLEKVLIELSDSELMCCELFEKEVNLND